MLTSLPASFPLYGYYGAVETRSTSVPSQYEYAVQITVALPQGSSATVTGTAYNAVENTTTVTVSSTPFTSALVGTPLVIAESGGSRLLPSLPSALPARSS